MGLSQTCIGPPLGRCQTCEDDLASVDYGDGHAD